MGRDGKGWEGIGWDGKGSKEMQGDGAVDIPISAYTDTKDLLKVACTSVLMDDSKLR